MKPVNIAILSCNHGHAKCYYALRNDPMFNLVAVSTVPGYENAPGLSDFPDIPRYKSDKELYEAHPELEAVIIASDNKSHMAQVREACERRLHIFSMKVPTFDMDEYQEMIRLSEEAGVVFMIELEMRYQSAVYRVKDVIESGQIGELLSINMVNYSHNPVWWRPWQADPEDSYGKVVPLKPNDHRFRGGALADHPHVFDAIRFITGANFKMVYADVAPNIREQVETEDLVRVIGKLDNGALFSIDPSYANNEHHVSEMVDWESYPRCVEVFMTAVGTEGTIIADLYGKTFCFQRPTNGDYLVNSAFGTGLWIKRIADFYHCVREGKKPPVGLHEHIDSIRAMNAAYDSVSTGEVVVLDQHQV